MVDTPPHAACCNEQPERPVRIALAHDWLVGTRGGELVLDAIARAVTSWNRPAAITRLYTMFDSSSPITPAIDAIPRSVSPLNGLPGSLRRWLLPAYPAAVAALSRRLARDHAREPLDLLVSTSSAAIKGLRAPPGAPHVCYCHTPARYLWSQTDQYESGGLKGAARGVGLGVWRDALREWDRDTSDRVDVFIANSEHTRAQIRHAYGRDAEVIHPPVRTGFFTPDASVERDGSLLVVSALEPYKRVDVAIDAAAACGRELVVIGTGSHERALRSHADRTPGARVRFVGRASDEAVRDAMRRAWAFLMPQVEDFGITSVEAQACGTPVVAMGAGGALDTVIDGRTGALVATRESDAWAAAIRAISPLEMAVACRSNAERFAESRFREAVLRLLGRKLP